MLRRLLRQLHDLVCGRRERSPLRAKKIDRRYVSEFSLFIDRFLQEHPEVPPDQARGRGMYWDKKLDLDALDKAAQDSVPAEPYSYYSPLAGPRPEQRDKDKPPPAG